jgi:hypothetical protein
MALKNTVAAIALQTIDTSTLSPIYQLITATTGLPESCFLIHFINGSDVAVTVSYDGVTDHDIMPADTHVTLNFQTNSSPSNFSAHMARKTLIYVKGTAGTGNFSVAGYYQPYTT